MAKLELSARAASLPYSGIRIIYDKAHSIPDTVHLEVGEPDVPTPDHVAKAGRDAIDVGFTHYTPSAGIIELREAISRKLLSDNNLRYDAETELVVTSGATPALALALFALVDPDAEVLVPDPGWANYDPIIRLVEGRPVGYPLTEENDFRPSIEEIEALVSDKTKVILINSPSNPTGAVFEKEDLQAIADLAVARNLFVISDEVYEKLVYDDHDHYSIASFDQMRDRTVTVNAFSKTYSMTGWRLGYAAAPPEIAKAILRLNSCCNTCASSVSQAAGLAALSGPQDCVVSMVREYQRRRDFFVKGLNKIPGFRCVEPGGAFYAFGNVTKLGKPSFELALTILEEGKVASVPGSFFGPNGEGYLRFSYAASMEVLEEALSRLEAVVESGKLSGATLPFR